MKIIISGFYGVMGGWLNQFAKEDGGFEIIGGLDVKAAPDQNVFATAAELPQGAECIIDFSRASALDEVLSYALQNKCATILATTGYTDDQKKKINDASKQIPVLNSGNFSIGVNLMTRLVEQISKALGEDFDIEIIEAHHHRKVDSPSGTANMLLEAAQKGRTDLDQVNYGRHCSNDPRSPHEVCVHSIRGGTIVGEHTVMFAGTDELIEIKHTALSRAIFAKGALKAAKKLVKAKPGYYTTKDVL